MIAITIITSASMLQASVFGVVYSRTGLNEQMGGAPCSIPISRKVLMLQVRLGHDSVDLPK